MLNYIRCYTDGPKMMYKPKTKDVTNKNESYLSIHANITHNYKTVFKIPYEDIFPTIYDIIHTSI